MSVKGVLLGVLGLSVFATFGLLSVADYDNTEAVMVNNTAVVEEVKVEPVVVENVSETPAEYTVVAIEDLENLLEGNAQRVEEKYVDKKVEITGVITRITTDGYFKIESSSDRWWAFDAVKCNFPSEYMHPIKSNKIQKQFNESFNVGDYITVRGVITDVDDLYGYSLVIDEIVL